MTLKFEDKILDNVHGFIELTHVECRIIELPLFKRLRQLKQLSLADWVFPGAEHTRYIHSLGVMHIVDQIAQKLSFNDEERQLMRLAGLLHDLGHYPLSHVGEAVYMDDRITDPAYLVDDQAGSVRKKIKEIPQERVGDYMKQSNNHRHHEMITAKVIMSDRNLHRIVEEECPYIDLRDVCDIIVGCVDRKPELSAKVQIMHSELDADRIDYIMRDATFSGTSFGGFELGMLLDNLRIGKYLGVDIVGVTPKGISSADQFLINRYFSYSQIIFNKHVAILGFMARTWIEHCIRQGWMKKRPEFEQIIKNHNDSRDFLNQTDTMFWSTLNRVDEVINNEYVPKAVKKIAAALSDYSELAYRENSEIRIITADASEAFKRLKDISMTENTIPLLDICTYTKHLPLKEYIDKLTKRFEREAEDVDMKDEDILTSLIHRMQDGLAVIDGPDVHLLVDDKRSMMPSLYKNKLYLYREYTL